jgi:hypothetical protein
MGPTPLTGYIWSHMHKNLFLTEPEIVIKLRFLNHLFHWLTEFHLRLNSISLSNISLRRMSQSVQAQFKHSDIKTHRPSQHARRSAWDTSFRAAYRWLSRGLNSVIQAINGHNLAFDEKCRHLHQFPWLTTWYALGSWQVQSTKLGPHLELHITSRILCMASNTFSCISAASFV